MVHFDDAVRALDPKLPHFYATNIFATEMASGQIMMVLGRQVGLANYEGQPEERTLLVDYNQQIILDRDLAKALMNHLQFLLKEE